MIRDRHVSISMFQNKSIRTWMNLLSDVFPVSFRGLFIFYIYDGLTCILIYNKYVTTQRNCYAYDLV